MRIRVTFFALVAALSFPLSAVAQEWAAPRLRTGGPDEWKNPIVHRRIEVDAGVGDRSKWVALYTAADFNKLRDLSKSPCENARCGVRVVHTLRSDSDVESFKEMVLQTTTPWLMHYALEAGLAAATGAVAGGVVGGIAGLLYAAFVEVADGTVQDRAADFASVVAKGGEVRYAEALRGSGPYTLERAVYYRVRVGDEIRIFPLWLDRMRAEIAGPAEAPTKTLEDQAREADEKLVVDNTPAPKHADCVAWKALLQYAHGWKVTSGSDGKDVIWKWGSDNNLITTADGASSNPSGFRLRTDPRATATGCMIQIIGYGNAFIDGYERGELRINTGGQTFVMKKRAPQ